MWTSLPTSQAEMNTRFDAMQRLMIQLFVGTIATFLTATIALIATQF